MYEFNLSLDLRRMATQSFVSQGNFAEMAVCSGAPTATYTHGLQVTTAGHAKSPSEVQQKTIQQQSTQQSILYTITPDNLTSNNKNEGILICYCLKRKQILRQILFTLRRFLFQIPNPDIWSCLHSCVLYAQIGL